MSEQLWTDKELKVAAFNLATTYLMDKSAGKATPLSQLIHVHLVEMRDKCATALDAANQRVQELERELAETRTRLSGAESAWDTIENLMMGVDDDE